MNLSVDWQNINRTIQKTYALSKQPSQVLKKCQKPYVLAKIKSFTLEKGSLPIRIKVFKKA